MKCSNILNKLDVDDVDNSPGAEDHLNRIQHVDPALPRPDLFFLEHLLLFHIPTAICDLVTLSN